MNNVNIIVEEEYDRVRIDKVIAECLCDISRSRIQKLIESNDICVNGNTIKASYKVSTNDSISVNMPDAVIPDIVPENIPLSIIYEDDDLIIVNKPKGMVVHPAPGHYSGTLVNALMYHCNDNLSGINGVLRPGIVHRIDRDTTGSVIACKNDFSHNSIAKQLAEHSIVREYRGIICGHLNERTGCVNAPIGRSPKDRKKMCVCTAGGKSAITHYEVLEEYKGYSLCKFRLETGRTHQIRVHMAYLGHPLAGDDVYGGGKCPVNTTGQALHAYILGFVHPRTSEYIETTAEFPSYFMEFLNHLKMHS